MDRQFLKKQILTIMEDHIGIEKAISASELFMAATGKVIVPAKQNKQTRIMRYVITEIRLNQEAAILSSGKGYWLAKNEQEVRDYYGRRVNEAKKRLNLSKREYDGALAALHKQISLNLETRND